MLYGYDVFHCSDLSRKLAGRALRWKYYYSMVYLINPAHLDLKILQKIIDCGHTCILWLYERDRIEHCSPYS